MSLNQSFDHHNFEYIFHKEKGNSSLKRKYFPDEYHSEHENFKSILAEKNNINRKLTTVELNDFKARLETSNEAKKEIRIKRFKQVEKTINSEVNPFNFIITKKTFKGTDIYTIDNDISSFFAMKQLQENLRRTFNIVPGNRNLIIKQLYSILNDNFPKVIVKTDIKSFYETIPHEQILHKINNNTLLSPLSKKLVKRVLYYYESENNGQRRGLPRGLGLSSCLSEIYLQDIDSSIKGHPHIIYYARYVDDIVAVFCPPTYSSRHDYLLYIEDIVKKHSLQLHNHQDKTKIITLLKCRENNVNDEFNLLGYKFLVNHNCKDHKINTNWRLEISKNKIERYKNRIDQTVIQFNLNTKNGCCFKSEKKLLKQRLRFITGNFRLKNAKKNILSGFYYSNHLLSISDESKLCAHLQQIDNNIKRSLYREIDKNNYTIHDREKFINAIVNEFSFSKSFINREKYFHTFSLDTYNMIKSIWND